MGTMTFYVQCLAEQPRNRDEAFQSLSIHESNHGICPDQIVFFGCIYMVDGHANNFDKLRLLDNRMFNGCLLFHIRRSAS